MDYIIPPIPPIPPMPPISGAPGATDAGSEDDWRWSDGTDWGFTNWSQNNKNAPVDHATTLPNFRDKNGHLYVQHSCNATHKPDLYYAFTHNSIIPKAQHISILPTYPSNHLHTIESALSKKVRPLSSVSQSIRCSR